jgi:hypothetical protein
MGQSSGWLMSRNSITDFCASVALALWVRTIMPLVTGCRARRHRLGHLFDVDQAHAAVGRDRQLLVIAEVRDVGAGLRRRRA